MYETSQSTCPYSDCRSGTVSGDSRPAYCSDCHQPVTVCEGAGCRAANHALAHYCRRCGDPLRAPDRVDALVALPKNTSDPRKIEVTDRLWQPPISHADFLWFLTERGSFYRLSMQQNQPVQVAQLGGEYGRSQFALTRLRLTPESGVMVPVAVAASDSGLAAVNLATGEWQMIFLATERGRFIADTEQHCVALAQDDSFLYAPFKDDETAGLLRISREEPAASLVMRIQEGETIVGPGRFRDRVFCYSAERLYVAGDGRLEAFDWPVGFRPCVTQHEVQQDARFRPPSGSPPFIVTGEMVYVLGWRNSKPALLTVSRFSPKPAWSQATMPSGNSGVLSQGDDGQLVVQQSGQILQYHGTSPRRLMDDDELGEDGLPYASGSVCAGRVSVRNQRESLRFYETATKLQDDCSVKQFNDYEAGMAFRRCAGHLVHVYLTDAREMRVLVW